MDLLSVGEVARRSGLAVSAIHFYEAKGLIRSVRSRGNQRRFERAELRRIAVIKIGQRAGITLAEIGEVLSRLPADRAVSVKQWTRLSQHWKGRLDERIARLTALRDKLGDCIGCGCLSLDRCWLRNPDDKLGEKGPGPRLLRFRE